MAGISWERKIKNRWFLHLDFSKSITTTGRATDTDYAGDGRTNQTYHIKLSSAEGGTIASEADAGYIILASKNFEWKAAMGYRFEQQLRILTAPDAANRLRTSYRSRWNNAFIRIAALQQLTEIWQLEGTVQLNLGVYAAQANWNLVNNYQHPVSFEHFADSRSLDLAVKIFYTGTAPLNPFVHLQWQHALTSVGDDLLYRSSGEILRSQFNGAESRLLRVQAGARFLF